MTQLVSSWSNKHDNSSCYPPANNQLHFMPFSRQTTFPHGTRSLSVGWFNPKHRKAGLPSKKDFSFFDFKRISDSSYFCFLAFFTWTRDVPPLRTIFPCKEYHHPGSRATTTGKSVDRGYLFQVLSWLTSLKETVFRKTLKVSLVETKHRACFCLYDILTPPPKWSIELPTKQVERVELPTSSPKDYKLAFNHTCYKKKE